MSAVPDFAPDTISPFLRQRATVPGLAMIGLDQVPDDLESWRLWRDAVLAYRETVRRLCAKDRQQQAAELRLCREDPVYWIIMYGVIFEPRKLNNEPPRWLPWVLYPFQIKVLRAMQYSMTTDENGRGDFIAEKSRDMGMTWLCAALIDWYFLFTDAFVAGVVSRNAESVDKTFSSDSVFFKIKANLGLIPYVPEKLGLPKWMKPSRLTDDYVVTRTIQHPDKMCVIQGETTTELAGVSGRATVRFNDELARFQDGQGAWANQGPVSNHRWGVSSADMKNPVFKQLADRGKMTLEHPKEDGPTFVRLDYWIHPEHTPEWLERERARYRDQPYEFEREYLINYKAGQGGRVYPNFERVSLSHAPYSPTLGRLWCAIDPGISDPTVMIWIQEDKIAGRFRVVNAFQGHGGEGPEFIASVLTGIPVSGYAGHNYHKYPGLLDLMEWTRSLRRAVQYIGDPFGANRGADGRRTFYQALREESDKLTNGSNIVTVLYNTKAEDGDARTFQKRKRAVEGIWYRVDFDRNPGSAIVLTALQDSRYPEQSRGVNPAEVLEPKHDEFSHLRSAFEYWAVDIQLMEVVELKQPEKARRVSLSGKVR